MNKIIYLVFIFSILSSQNIDLYFSLVDEGELDGVKESLPELLSKYPSVDNCYFSKQDLNLQPSMRLVNVRQQNLLIDSGFFETRQKIW